MLQNITVACCFYRKALSKGAYGHDPFWTKCFWRASTWLHNNRYYNGTIYIKDNVIVLSDLVESSGYSSKTLKKGSCPYPPLDEVLWYCSSLWFLLQIVSQNLGNWWWLLQNVAEHSEDLVLWLNNCYCHKLLHSIVLTCCMYCGWIMVVAGKCCRAIGWHVACVVVELW